jgi:hypothetical protein
MHANDKKNVIWPIRKKASREARHKDAIANTPPTKNCLKRKTCSMHNTSTEDTKVAMQVASKRPHCTARTTHYCTKLLFESNIDIATRLS